MKDARELLAQLRAAGVEPMSDDETRSSAQRGIASHQRRHRSFEPAFSTRLLVTLLEAQARLAEVRRSLEHDLCHGLPTSAAEVLEILDREPGP